MRRDGEERRLAARAAERKYKAANRDRIQDARQRYRASEHGRIKARDYRLRKEYGISQAEYDEKHSAQGGVCAVCMRPETRIARNMVSVGMLSVDHDHTTGAIRGLLCHGCNSAIGLLSECPDRMRALAQYIEAYKDKRDVD